MYVHDTANGPDVSFIAVTSTLNDLRSYVVGSSTHRPKYTSTTTTTLHHTTTTQQQQQQMNSL